MVEEKCPERLHAVCDETFAFEGDVVDFGLVAAVFTPGFDRSGGGSRKSYRCSLWLANDFAEERRREEAMDTDSERFLDTRRCRVDVKMRLRWFVSEEVLAELFPERWLLH